MIYDFEIDTIDSNATWEEFVQIDNQYYLMNQQVRIEFRDLLR